MIFSLFAESQTFVEQKATNNKRIKRQNKVTNSQ